jgi:hypothetical protein
LDTPERTHAVEYRDLGRKPLVSVVGSLLLSGFIFAMTAWDCNRTDGSFKLSDPFARPSSECRSAGLSGGMNPGELLRDLVIYLAPALLLLCGWVIAFETGRRWFFYIGVAGAAVITVIQLALFAGSNVGYAGQG